MHTIFRRLFEIQRVSLKHLTYRVYSEWFSVLRTSSCVTQYKFGKSSSPFLYWMMKRLAPHSSPNICLQVKSWLLYRTFRLSGKFATWLSISDWLQGFWTRVQLIPSSNSTWSRRWASSLHISVENDIHLSQWLHSNHFLLKEF